MTIKQVSLFCMTMLLSILSSCGDDDSANPSSGGQSLRLNGETDIQLNYAVLEGLISTGSHYSYMLSLFDQQIDYQNLAAELPNVQAFLRFNFFSACPESIGLGEYKFVSTSDMTVGRLPESGYFTSSSALTRLDDNGTPTLLQVNEGTVRILASEAVDPSSDQAKLEVEFDVVLSDGSTLAGTYRSSVELATDVEILEEGECEGSDTNTDGSEGFEANGQQLNIIDGVIYDLGANSTHKEYYVLMSSEQIDPDNAAFTEGETHFELVLYSESETELNEGRYDFSDVTVPRNYLGTGTLLLDFDPLTAVSSGWVNISRSGQLYTIEVDVEFESGRDVRGRFTHDFELVEDILPDNSFTWNESDFEIEELVIQDVGYNGSDYQINFYLLTGDYESLTSESDYQGVTFTTYSVSTEGLVPGDFKLINSSDTPPATGNFALSLVYDNLSERENEAVSGNLEIDYDADSDTFRLLFTKTISENSVVEGYYEGTYTVIPPDASGGRKMTFRK
ncbi:hypothetical protein [Tunicatimonas pelagia]|uniref:hypothetical protein n=1 Tax=Tunicatimonas pelagia TaxID=931531 RepID=UPI002665E51E|nr:hypothetical protein [Tunicatimonas pelagia]WKN43060.1 hypothetical protein P0M28_28895 [Tunicatimonas pelagia]